MESIKLNLSRKWRSQTFEGIVGQNLAIKMLKNSLYVKHYFPVYLFAGQRGCGKTTTARVFAGALNCDALSNFQAKPRSIEIPCGACPSCCAMHAGKHPDFIEIDAASHTGVDNIRQIIEAATLLPLIGQKKIYLIDEAHMLSKAAFNALLKILEEPPRSTLFILATTDPEKIIETVRSRCFKLLFNAIEMPLLIKLLKDVCDAERIPYEMDGFSYIAAHAQGSARDALNTLEQVRFATGTVTKESVLSVLGHIDDACLLALIQKTYAGSVQEVLSAWKTYGMDRVSSDFAWRRLLVLCRTLIWLHHGVIPTDMHGFLPTLIDAAKNIPLVFIHRMMESLYHAEQWFLRSSMPQGLLEMVLLQLCSFRSKSLDDGDNVGGALMQGKPSQDSASVIPEELSDNDTHSDINEDDTQDSVIESNTAALWATLLSRLIESNDQLTHSLFSQKTTYAYDATEQKIIVIFPAALLFFAERLAETSAMWLPIVRSVFGSSTVMLIPRFEGESLPVQTNHEKTFVDQHKNNVEIATVPTQKPAYVSRSQSWHNNTKERGSTVVREASLDVSDCTVWPQVNLILEYFPGTVTVVKEARQ